ncbi:4-hydroxy-tetrahydrodipicolinate reductase [Pelotomaculum terephthalicicum JT]|uniref:4-hydroxy-tetrahydrodipicolinate reductase n=1 Tax=Pelotomaculum TaxID=191373 RepID=UPI0009D554F3|nr:MULTISPECIES: 4-hydroxy-tetrahydrodipicolinate reductase [Pelotomaculum]MCG9967749.1 4-hydroxy-tetrahydrodipicolinate reductase [Pelotomaculum terephthalicicum JT]OPX85367.1 MAG: 4-hydroxy-tetrahydrodipicolinate reductase [Pelotomaculum sp. PtaB.Bin117]OPY62700.1 MAG: 4-hydroxy-tetrahydrodipicolinate reductase [Pelotomaculum sp. PtaU1.Bin065]
MLRVIVAGAYGRMGREVVKAIWNSDDLELIGAADSRGEGVDVGSLIEAGEIGISIEKDLEELILRTRPDVVIDFTTPQAVYRNVMICLNHGVRPVVGTTGLSEEKIQAIIDLSKSLGVGGLIAPNFAIGAILMMRFASEAVRHFPQVEIIELHHDQKIDAPSGTSIKTAEAIIEQRGDLEQGPVNEFENIAGARGSKLTGGIRIHSVRLPGLVAHQEVIFGGLGQTLTIRHDSITRESFMPGILYGIRKVAHLERVVYGLDKLLFD